MNDEKGTSAPEGTARRRRPAFWRLVLLALLGAVVVMLVAGGGLAFWFLAHYGDSAPRRYMPIVNQTDGALTIYAPGWDKNGMSHRRKDEIAMIELGPDETEYTWGPCDFSVWIARDGRGREVARHQPTDLCAPATPPPWVIGGS